MLDRAGIWCSLRSAASTVDAETVQLRTRRAGFLPENPGSASEPNRWHPALMIYQPDEQDELIGDADAAGGSAFVQELHYLATEEADTLCPWDGDGEEPPLYRALWLDAARRLVAERRKQLGRAEATREGP